MFKGIFIAILGSLASLYFGVLWYQKGFRIEWIYSLKSGYDFQEGFGLIISIIAVLYGVIEILLNRDNSGNV